ncbi:SusC/RagA family TonB-linked outer membrane protein [Paraflavitalea sp. CAU 1676]|uniref:SusC/RagA family TonB-linked outer membrane protein n=1 Tax=Paraflavitalea sp. CAU 1676 TaxID=3032598 RepID=UPI0023DA2082|nr:SusC/RagA family TonB-linked outer membrane protein [Paraflavitalea sp. CAU 1676]MDF2190641.1 SusC/RagA family TonB-linked outer membrane protein [Paraflavitalea sp. CAU 1676]
MKKIPSTRLWLLYLALFLATALSGLGQSTGNPTAITGTVKSGNDPVPGATIALAGNRKVMTTTDNAGFFSLKLPAANTGNLQLIVSSIGFASRTVVLGAAQSSIEIVLLKDSGSVLSDVVVTALGIRKSRKAVTYAMSEVNGSEFTQARENNVANALTGRIAGVNATGLSTGPGGSSRVVIRGNGSLTGNSQPLYVINGMPIDNSVPGGSGTPNGNTIRNSTDRGDGIGAINPDDIESMTVLKGGAAAALYGSRGANGVILITTKKGRAQKGIGVEYNGTLTLEDVAVFPDYQYEYGQGDNGVKPTTLAQAQATGRRSFGAKIDGSTDYMAADGKTHPYSAQKDNLKNFYNTGSTFTNTVAMSGGNENVVYRMSLSDLNAKSILPGNKYNRKTANFNISAKLSDKLRFESVIQYNLEKGTNRPIAGDALGNPNWTPYEVANTVDIRWLDPGYDANGNEIVWNDAGIVTNSYFVTKKFKQTDTKNRFIGQAAVSYDILKNLTVKGTVTRDFYNYNFTSIVPTGTQYWPNGQYDGIKSDVSETNSMLTATYKGNVANALGFTILAGGNTRRYKQDELTLAGRDFTTPYFYSFSNLSTSSTVPVAADVKTNSVFASVDLDYKNVLFLTASGRQDWFSTLSPANNSIFYPSVGTSFILSDVLNMPAVVDLVKLRASWAQVGGGGPDPYAINLAYSSVPSSSSVPLQNVSSTSITNASLKPFTSTTIEVGLNTQLFGGRLGLDVALYDRKSSDDIVSVPISTAAGYTNAILNSGELSNKGIELLLDFTPIKRKDFTWNSSFNFAYNKSEVLKLADGISTFSVGNSVNGNAFINNQVGSTYGAIYGFRKLRDANGNIIYDPNSNLPLQTDINQELGKGVPPLTMGFSNTFRYKNFSLDVLVDGKFGNSIFSVMEVYATRLGLMKTTLAGRENGLLLEGVTKAGAKYSYTVPVANLRAAYYNNLNRYTELFVHDASFVKLRQVILSYKLPDSFLKKLGVQSSTISLVGRNLLILYKETDNFDPEQSLTNGAAQGIESIGLPRTRSYGVNLQLKF